MTENCLVIEPYPQLFVANGTHDTDLRYNRKARVISSDFSKNDWLKPLFFLRRDGGFFISFFRTINRSYLEWGCPRAIRPLAPHQTVSNVTVSEFAHGVQTKQLNHFPLRPTATRRHCILCRVSGNEKDSTGQPAMFAHG